MFDGSGTFDELLTADYTVLDATAAKFYGVAGTGRVTYPTATRAGVLGHAAVLATTAHSDQTSPIVRGLLVRRNFLCQELPPPPPNAGGVPEVDPNATTRERFAMHSRRPGVPRLPPVHRQRRLRLRALRSGRPLARRPRTASRSTPSGDMNDVERLGTDTSAPYTSLPELAQTIAASQPAPSCFVRQYLRFSRGLRETLAERCGRLGIEDKFAAARRRHPRADGAERPVPRLRGAPMSLIPSTICSSSAALPRSRCRCGDSSRRTRPRTPRAKRLIVFYFPDGVVGRVASRRAEPVDAERRRDLVHAARPARAARSRIADSCVFFRGLSMGPTDGGSHPGGAKKLLTATDGGNGISIDQRLAQTVGAGDPFNLLYLGAQANAEQRVGRQVHLVRRARLHRRRPRTIRSPRSSACSARSGTTSGGGGGGDGVATRAGSRVLDNALGELDDAARRSSATTEKAKLDLHLEALREVETADPGASAADGGAACTQPVDRRDGPRRERRSTSPSTSRRSCARRSI